MAKSFKDFPPAAQAGVVSLLALIVVAIPFYLYVYPLLGQRAALDDEVKTLIAENKQNQAVEQEHTQYQIKIAQLKTQLETQRLLLPDTQATDEFMKTVFKDAAEAGVHVRTFLPQPPSPKDYYVEVPYKVRLDGTYWELVNYFRKLSGETRIISVTNIALGPPAGGGLGSFEVSPSESVGADCTLVTYFNKQATPAPVTTKK
jgi:type IV pilus assembly protein PilO